MTKYPAAPNLPKPARFDEWFTIGRDAVGEPIQCQLREMTADDVLASLDWYLQEQQRLLSNDDPITTTMPILQHASDLTDKYQRLLFQVWDTIRPQRQLHGRMGVPEAVRRFWKGAPDAEAADR